MTLKPLPQQVLTAARLRKIAAEIILEAEALEAEFQTYQPTKPYEFKHSLKNRRAGKI